MNWKKKLTSRKFWISVITFVYNVIFSTEIAETEAGTIVGIIMATLVALGYVAGEAIVDSKFVKGGDEDGVQEDAA